MLISTIRFPQFRRRLCERLEQLRAEEEIHDQFRLIVDLQGYAANDISDSFLFDEAITFHMTEQNTEEFEGFDDIWSAILDERVLVKLGDKIDALRDKLLEEQRPRAKDADDQSDDMSASQSSVRKDAEPESPSNFKLIDNTIKSEVQKSLYKQFMNESKIENQGLKFDLMRAQEPSEESEELVPAVVEEEQKALEEEVKEGTTNSRSGPLPAVASAEGLGPGTLPGAPEEEAKADSAQEPGSQSNREQIDDGPTERAEASHRLEGPEADAQHDQAPSDMRTDLRSPIKSFEGSEALKEAAVRSALTDSTAMNKGQLPGGIEQFEEVKRVEGSE